jgi:putative zinc finger protein/fervidolysin-like protein
LVCSDEDNPKVKGRPDGGLLGKSERTSVSAVSAAFYEHERQPQSTRRVRTSHRDIPCPSANLSPAPPFSGGSPMTGRVLPFDASAHAAVDARLPFYVNGTLRGEELSVVEQHVRTCERCQREVKWLRELFAACAEIPLAQYPTPDHRPVRALNWQTRAFGGWRTTNPWLRGLLAAQLAAIAILGTLLATDTRNDATYRTLSSASRLAEGGEAIAVMFDPAITEREMRQILDRVGARIVDGPTVTQAYVVEVPAARSAEAVKLLRAEKLVRLAQPLGPRAQQ